MEQNQHPAAVQPAAAQVSSSQRFSRGALILLILFGVFTLGMYVGEGRIKLPLGFQPHSENNNLPATLDYATVNQVYMSLKANYDGKLTESQLIDGLKHGLAESTKDPYTVYFTAKEAKDFNDELNNSFSGIGAELGQDKDGNLEVISPLAGLPAEKAGLKPQDLITEINGKSTAGESVDDAVSKIRGQKGTKVKLQVVRSHSQTLNFTITRDDITVPSVTTKILAGNIGYVQISTFANDTSDLMQKAADKFKSAHVKGIILDLRENPGGLVQSAINTSGLWLKNGQTIFTSKGTEGTQLNTANGDGELNGIPTVVLIDAGSASASEITTGALHDNHDAYVIGAKSYGKGVEQSLINFDDDSQLKVTIASWYRPNGQNINHKGITPDKTVKEPTNAKALASSDAQFQAALTYLTSH
ncbi:MAG TPA: S41 family peptidase [Candidatus Saccharimonadales bacterium]|nr:S41 family peptidase [Candidatus Saccharimonadales bacterium]